MTILVIAEHDHGTLKGATLNTVAAAQKIGGEIHILVAGHNADGAAKAAAQIAGVATTASHPIRMYTDVRRNLERGRPVSTDTAPIPASVHSIENRLHPHGPRSAMRHSGV